MSIQSSGKAAVTFHYQLVTNKSFLTGRNSIETVGVRMSIALEGTPTIEKVKNVLASLNKIPTARIHISIVQLHKPHKWKSTEGMDVNDEGVFKNQERPKVFFEKPPEEKKSS